MIAQVEPWIDGEELKEVTAVICSTWLTEAEKTAQFEQQFANLTHTRHAIAVNNATGGLFVCLKAFDIGVGDEVIVPSLTFVATINAVVMAGATPVLADVDLASFNLSIEEVEKAITPKTKAIMPVHLYGQACDLDQFRALADKYHLHLIEDAAQAVGTLYKNKPVGGIGELACFSFFGNKTMTTGQGGMLTTNNEDIAKRCYSLKNHGRTTRGTFIHEHIGFNFCFSELQAAIGLAQLRKLDQILSRKKAIEQRYKSQLFDISDLRFPHIDPKSVPMPWFSNILVDNPAKLAIDLQAKGIQTRRFFPPIHQQPCYHGLFNGHYPNAERIYNSGLSLPSGVLLTDEQIDFVAQNIRDSLAA
jgi:perosamine synthetase